MDDEGESESQVGGGGCHALGDSELFRNFNDVFILTHSVNRLEFYTLFFDQQGHISFLFFRRKKILPLILPDPYML